MTPAERARQIDREEFEAECARIRQRAYALLELKSKPDPRVKAWLAKPYEQLKFYRNYSAPLSQQQQRLEPILSEPPKRQRRAVNARMITMDGKTHSLAEWADMFGLKPGMVHKRLHLGWSVEKALRTPKQPKRNRGKREPATSTPIPGVSSHLSPSRETGDQGTLHDASNITFSEDANQ